MKIGMVAISPTSPDISGAWKSPLVIKESEFSIGIPSIFPEINCRIRLASKAERLVLLLASPVAC